nr:leucine-rich repeat domain-containing protein [Bacteroidales bacterium]
FNWCYALKEMHLPVTLSEIDYRAFDDCKSLQKLYVESKNPPVFVDVNPHWRFASDSKNLTVYVPNESVENYKKAEGWRNLDIQSM